ncbi:hypothetical protein HXX76_012469 [Chlamydomonas incerta]|uniref:Uncharacterized protein n=1 Tax=Chlamydomonas incerta TaxID=51695 RepID=A0A835VVD8_CHLIN|nr:hypothetical protein HXX76_012469 [Chlamydomonas incerta]|eukprot:KAG2427273.1 hypothetical protein HXX76_012469 [Chlamydomonas incerta]
MKHIDRETAAALRDSYKTLYLAQPHIVEWRDVEKPHLAQQPWPGPEFVDHWGRAEPWRALTLPQRRRLLCLAASSRHAASLDVALAHCGCEAARADQRGEALAAAAAAGWKDGCQQLLQGPAGFEPGSGWWAIATAALGGHLTVLQPLIEATDPNRGEHVSCETLRRAAFGACSGGHTHILAWLQQAYGYSPSLEEVEAAARAGQVTILESLMSQRPECRPPGERTSETGTAVAQQQDQQRWARRRLLSEIAYGCPAAVLQRHYDTLWPRQRERPATAGAAAAGAATAAAGLPAAAGVGDGQQDPQQDPQQQQQQRWVPDGADLDSAACDLLAAAAGSRTRCWAAKLAFLLAAWGPGAVARLLSRGDCISNVGNRVCLRPDCLQRLRHIRDLGMQLDERVATQALMAGRAEALAFLWDECGVRQALSEDWLCCGAGAGEPHMLRFLSGRGLLASYGVARVVHEIEWGASDEKVLVLVELAAEGGGQRMGMQRGRRRWWVWLDWSSAFNAAARHGAGLAVLRMLRERRGAAVDLAAVACGGSEEALEWAAAELAAAGSGLQVLSEEEAQEVARRGNTAALAWLRDRGLLPPPPPPPGEAAPAADAVGAAGELAGAGL